MRDRAELRRRPLVCRGSLLSRERRRILVLVRGRFCWLSIGIVAFHLVHETAEEAADLAARSILPRGDSRCHTPRLLRRTWACTRWPSTALRALWSELAWLALRSNGSLLWELSLVVRSRLLAGTELLSGLNLLSWLTLLSRLNLLSHWILAKLLPTGPDHALRTSLLRLLLLLLLECSGRLRHTLLCIRPRC